MNETGHTERVDPSSLPVAAAYVVDGRVAATTDEFDTLVGAGSGALTGDGLGPMFGPEEYAELLPLLSAPSDVGVRWLAMGGVGADGMPFVVDVSVGTPDGSGGRWVTAVPSGPLVVRPEDPAPDYVRRSQWETLGVDRVLSHDVRAALRGSSSFLSLLDRAVRPDLAEDSAEFLDTASAATSRADEMVERLVRLLRIGIRPVRVAPVALDDLVTDALTVSAAEFDDETTTVGSPTVQADLDGEVLVDRGLLVDCLAELVTNARKFKAGPVSLTMAAETRAPWVYVRVSDDGAGIPGEFVEDVFSPFRLLQAKGRYPGVGLGLTTCREIARVHGGACWVEAPSAGSVGATVVLRLPAAGVPG